MEEFDWWGGKVSHENGWDMEFMEDTEHTEQHEDLRPLDHTFMTDLIVLKHHCYDLTSTKDSADSDRAQSMAPLQEYVTLLSTIHDILQSALCGKEQHASLPASVQERMDPLLEWIHAFHKTHPDPVDRLPIQSYLRMNMKEYPYVQIKIME